MPGRRPGASGTLPRYIRPPTAPHLRAVLAAHLARSSKTRLTVRHVPNAFDARFPDSRFRAAIEAHGHARPRPSERGSVKGAPLPPRSLIFIKVNITGGRLFYSRCLESGANEKTADPHRVILDGAGRSCFLFDIRLTSKATLLCATRNDAKGQQPTSGRPSRAESSQISWPPILIEASADGYFNRGIVYGKSIHDGEIHRGDAALGSSRHRNACGTGGADRQRHGETDAPRAAHRGDGAAHCRRADHGDRVDQVPASHFL